MKEVSAALIIRKGKVLLTRRSPDEKNGGYWEFPGGKREEGETIQESLKRELKEELAVDSTIGNIFEESIFHYPGGGIKLIGIFAEVDTTDFCLSVHDKADWVRSEELLTYQLSPADIPIAEKLIEEVL